MKTFRGAWSIAGLLAGAAGLATSYIVATVMAIRDQVINAYQEIMRMPV